MRLPMPCPRWAVVGLMLAGCPGGNADETSDATVNPSTGGAPTTGPTSSEGSSGPADSSTGATCPEGTLGCPCSAGGACSGALECQGGTCREPEGSTSTGPDETTSSGPAMCGNGQAEAGDLCLGDEVLLRSMGAGAIAVTVANFDRNPALDVVTANRDANSISIRPGTGSGDFGVQFEFDVGTAPIGVGHGDFNGDGNLDVVTVNATNVTTVAGNGSGDFDPPVATALTGALLTPTALVVDDLENDGDPDVLVTESTMALVHVLRTDMGVFLPDDTYAVGPGPAAIQTADFSSDGVLDVITANTPDNSVSLLLGNGLGQVGGATTVGAGTAPSDVAVGDLNDDGQIDAVVVGPTEVTVRLGNGLGDLGGQQNFPVPGGPVALVSADLDLDGHSDVAVVGGDSMVHVLLATGTGSLVPTLDIAVDTQPEDIVAADLNEDGLLDLITANVTMGTISVILSNA